MSGQMDASTVAFQHVANAPTVDCSGILRPSDADPAVQAGQLVAAGNDLRSVRIEVDQRLEQPEVKRSPHLTIPASLIWHEPIANRMIAARLQRFEQWSEVFGLWRHAHADIVP